MLFIPCTIRRKGANLNRSVIHLQPWKEDYQETLDKNNTVLFLLQNGSIDARAYGDVAGIFGQTDYYYYFSKKEREALVAFVEDARQFAREIGIALLFCTFSAVGQDATKGNVSALNSTADMLFMLLQIQADVQGSLNDLDLDDVIKDWYNLHHRVRTNRRFYVYLPSFSP